MYFHVSTNSNVPIVANKVFPLVYSAVDSTNTTLKYASVFPMSIPSGITEMDVYMVDNGCDTGAWEDAISAVANPNTTIFAFPVLINGCSTDYIGNYNGLAYHPKYIMAYNSQTNDLYQQSYNVPEQGFFSGSPQFTNVAYDDGVKLAANYAEAGGYLKYKLRFPSKHPRSLLFSEC